MHVGWSSPGATHIDVQAVHGTANRGLQLVLNTRRPSLGWAGGVAHGNLVVVALGRRQRYRGGHHKEDSRSLRSPTRHTRAAHPSAERGRPGPNITHRMPGTHPGTHSGTKGGGGGGGREPCRRAATIRFPIPFNPRCFNMVHVPPLLTRPNRAPLRPLRVSITKRAGRVVSGAEAFALRCRGASRSETLKTLFGCGGGGGACVCVCVGGGGGGGACGRLCHPAVQLPVPEGTRVDSRVGFSLYLCTCGFVCVTPHGFRCVQRAAVLSAFVATALASGGVYNSLASCNSSSPTQKWAPGPKNELIANFNGAAYCLDVSVRCREKGKPRVSLRPVLGCPPPPPPPTPSPPTPLRSCCSPCLGPAWLC